MVKGHLPYQFNIDIPGDRGTVRNNRVSLHGQPDAEGFHRLAEPGPDSGDVGHHPFGGLIRYFIDCIASGQETTINLENAMLTHEFCFAALLSERTGAPIKLPLGEADQRAIHQLLAQLSLCVESDRRAWSVLKSLAGPRGRKFRPDTDGRAVHVWRMVDSLPGTENQRTCPDAPFPCPSSVTALLQSPASTILPGSR